MEQNDWCPRPIKSVLAVILTGQCDGEDFDTRGAVFGIKLVDLWRVCLARG